MARVRFFAQAREAAGCREADVDGDTVGAVLDSAVSQFGERLAAIIAMSAVWLNGERAGREDPVSDGDEVAVLPPVSGG
jgi:molybdopterin synthase catalytic subunit/molybdopterin synthase sulfur carrier subunit